MAIIFQVTVTNDETGEVEKTYIASNDGERSYDVARCVRSMLSTVFNIEYPDSPREWWGS